MDRALQLRIAGNYSDAIQEYDRAIAIDPSFAAAYYGRGYCFSQIPKYADAKSDFDIGIRLDPTIQSEYTTFIRKVDLRIHAGEIFTRSNVQQTIDEKFPHELREKILTELDTLVERPGLNSGNETLLAQVQLSILQLSAADGKFIIDGDYKKWDWRDAIMDAGYG